MRGRRRNDMANYLEIPIGRVWRLNVRARDVQTEYLVADVQLADVINSIAWDAEIQDFQCVPYDLSNKNGVWMTTPPAREAAA
jgi:hypothetical protein